jgi:hypothetical protein
MGVLRLHFGVLGRHSNPRLEIKLSGRLPCNGNKADVWLLFEIIDAGLYEKIFRNSLPTVKGKAAARGQAARLQI